jgi:membrane-bound lytic murein transglycosylase D
MTAILYCQSGSLKGREVKLKRDVTLLGRKTDNHIVFEEEVVSSYHAEIRRKGDSYLLVDLEATNGTFVNGKPVEKVELRNHDKIELGEGGPLVQFHCEGEDEDKNPRLKPLSGSWEKETESVRLEKGSTSLGRSKENDIVVGRTHGSVVSSRHAVVVVHSGFCELEDLESANGTFVNAKRISKTKLHDGDRVELGSGGPVFEFRWAAESRKARNQPAKESDKLLSKLERIAKGGLAGEQTRFIFEAANKYYRRRRWPLLMLCGVVLAGGLTTGYLYYRALAENRRIRAQAEALFYEIRAQQAKQVEEGLKSPADFRKYTNDRRLQEQAYDNFLKDLGLYEGKSPVQRAIMRLARRLGETDLHVPPDFYQTTLTYVEKWRSTPRLRRALEHARQRNLPQIIVKALAQYGLPREFFFLPLQESDYNAASVGEQTRFGIAKGLWQMIPSTAEEYHLRLGPLKNVGKYDPSDQRHDEVAATHAAVRYLAHIYSTRAAASGLLVIASYNFGETRVLRRLEKLPNDPRQCNFWNFYRNGWIPEETRDYVMKIFSAALICEKPELFQMNIEPIMPGW